VLEKVKKKPMTTGTQLPMKYLICIDNSVRYEYRVYLLIYYREVDFRMCRGESMMLECVECFGYH